MSRLEKLNTYTNNAERMVASFRILKCASQAGLTPEYTEHECVLEQFKNPTCTNCAVDSTTAFNTVYESLEIEHEQI